MVQGRLRPPHRPRRKAPVDWACIETVLLDMDGTLLDRHFDDHFYRETVPRAYAEKSRLTFEEARRRVFDAYRAAEGSLDWYDIDYWSRTLELDIPALKHQDTSRIRKRPQAMELLDHLRGRGLSMHLVADAHPVSLNLKLALVALNPI